MATQAPASARRIRVLITDDSVTARSLIRALIEDAPGLEVCGEASNGREALEQVLALEPDLVTMDLQMPLMDGMTAIREIMHQRPSRIIVVSEIADAAHAMEAVAAGALDALAKPCLDEGEGFIRRLRLLAGVPVIRHLRSMRESAAEASHAPTPLQPQDLDRPSRADAAASGAERAALPPLIAIAVSTGGPQALARLLPELPVDLPAAVLIAQHIAEGFAAGMVGWLNELCGLPVQLANEGERVAAGRGYVADSRTHLSLDQNGRFLCQPCAKIDIYRPSCDRLLSAAAAVVGSRAIGVILTGLGRDGVAGIGAIADAKGLTIAQDEASSVIFGMNQQAVLSGRVQRVLPLGEIAGALTQAAVIRACWG
jgi:two-component system chemotaxis response regulator CheB